MRILVADDDTKLNKLICATLREARYIPEASYTAQETLDKLRERDFDLLLLDWMFDGETLDGKGLVKIMEKEEKQIPILMLSGKSALRDKVDIFEAGVDDYLVKPFYLPEMLARVKALLRRKAKPKKKTKLKVENLTLDFNSGEVWMDGKKINLRNKEFQILECLLENLGELIKKDELVEKVWGESGDIPSNKVDVHLRSLRKALGDFGERIETIRGIGYRIAKGKK